MSATHQIVRECSEDFSILFFIALLALMDHTCLYAFLMYIESTTNRVQNFDNSGIIFPGHEFPSDFMYWCFLSMDSRNLSLLIKENIFIFRYSDTGPRG